MQLAVLLGVIAVVAERVRTLCFTSALDATAFRRTLAQLVRRSDERATDLVRAAKPAWVARAVWPLFDPDLPDEERAVEVEDQLMAVDAAAVRWMRPLRIGASIGSALGFIGAAVEIWWIFNGDHGLRALRAGLIESEGLTNAVNAIAIGIATSSLALGSWSVLKAVARERIMEARRVVSSIEEVLAKEGGPGTVRVDDATS